MDMNNPVGWKLMMMILSTVPPMQKLKRISSEKQVCTIDANNLQHQQLHDELEDQLSDFGDDVTPVTSQNGAILRRKLRMVIDPVDDE